MKTKKQFWTYIAVTFGLAWTLQIIASILAINGQTIYFNPIIALSMFVPLVGAIISKSEVSKIGWKPKFKGHIKYYIFSWFAPAVLGTIGAVLFFMIFPQCLGTLEEGLNAVGGEGFVDVLASQGVSPMLFFVIEILSALIYAPIINSFFACGEEAGWRGAMYPYLKERFGKVKGRILGGAIWGIWHWPIMILAGYEYGTNYLGAPVAGPFAFLIFTITLGILCDWVYEKSESIWTTSLLHGAINGFAGIPMLFMPASFAGYVILGPSFIGVISIIPILIVALIILLKEKNLKLKEN